jgi:hypothetical protein
MEGVLNMVTGVLDWSQCPAVESDVTPEEVRAVIHFASQSLAIAPAFG